MPSYNAKYNKPEWIGRKFGRLTVIEIIPNDKPGRWGYRWKCKCDCGREHTVAPRALIIGDCKSCGCYHDEVCAKKATKFKHSIYEYKRLHSIYHGVKKRCFNTKDARYKDYGGRGITMCAEWADKDAGFDRFVDWALANGYTDEMTIERIDVNGDYCPENCSWITRQEQRFNTRDTLWVEYKGERIQLMKLCKRMGVSYDTVHDRIYKRGWDLEKALTTPSQLEKSFAAECREHGINPGTARDRMVKFGWTKERALNTPSTGRGANGKTYRHD